MNRMIGGRAPSEYLAQIQKHAQVQLPDAEMNEILGTHLIETSLLRADDFDAFYGARKAELLRLIEKAMGKVITQATESVADDGDADDEDDEGGS